MLVCESDRRLWQKLVELLRRSGPAALFGVMGSARRCGAVHCQLCARHVAEASGEKRNYRSGDLVGLGEATEGYRALHARDVVGDRAAGGRCDLLSDATGPVCMSVRTGPGLTMLTRTPEGASSMASDREKLLSAAFAAEYSGALTAGMRALREETLTIAPRRSSRCGSAARTARTALNRLISKAHCQSSSVVDAPDSVVAAGLEPWLGNVRLQISSAKPKCTW
jgi:hypothetical protein